MPSQSVTVDPDKMTLRDFMRLQIPDENLCVHFRRDLPNGGVQFMTVDMMNDKQYIIIQEC